MSIPENLDHEKLAEVALAMLALTAHENSGVTRAWKGIDWDVMDMLYENGWIEDPKNRNQSVVLTDQGKALAEAFLERHFAAEQ